MMPMLRDIFKKLQQSKFDDLEILADGASLKNTEKSDNYVYFFLPGETALESKFRIALIIYESGKLGFCRFFIPSVYGESESEDWTLAKNSQILFDNMLQMIIGIQNIVDIIVFSLSKKIQWSLPIFHFFHQFYYMKKSERLGFFGLSFEKKKILALRALEFMPLETSVKHSKTEFFQLVGDLKESLLLVSDVSDVLTDLTNSLGEIYLFTR